MSDEHEHEHEHEHGDADAEASETGGGGGSEPSVAGASVTVTEAIEDPVGDDEVDTALDHAIDDLPRGDTEVREPSPVAGELPLLLSGRERFASIEAAPVTGDARVDAATARLEEVPDLPTSDHVEVYDDVHRRLQDALSDADAH